MSPTRNESSKPIGVAHAWYVQGRYVLNKRFWAEQPIYFDSLAEAEADTRRQRNWPMGSTERYVDLCQQRYTFALDGTRKMDIPLLLDAICKDSTLTAEDNAQQIPAEL